MYVVLCVHTYNTYKIMGKIKFNIRFRLEQRRKDSKDPKSELITDNLPINADITFSGRRVVYYTGHRIDAAKWVDNEVNGVRVQQVKRNNFNAKGESAATINEKLQRIKIAVANVFLRFEVNNQVPTPNSVRAELKKELNEETIVSKSVFDYYQQFIDEVSVSDAWSISTKKKHKTMMNLLKEFKPTLFFEDMTEDFFTKYVSFLIDEKQHINSYVNKSLKDIKWFLNWATRKGYNRNLDYQNFTVKLKGIAMSSKANIFALSADEFLHLYNLELKLPYLERVRDVFCFCCTTGLRYSDVKNLKWANVKESHIEFVTIKTDDPLIIPLNDFSKAIIKKYEVYKEVDDHVLPVISNQKYNKYLKTLGKAAGFDDEQTKVYYRGTERIEETFKKADILTSHVARKTFVTLGLFWGVPAEVIRSWTGHKDAKVMDRYVKFNNGQKSAMMERFNVDNGPSETIFDMSITDEERKALEIPSKNEYLALVANDHPLAEYHIAMLEKHRGNELDAFNHAAKLPDDLKLKFMHSLSK